jgi:hypothetical protein
LDYAFVDCASGYETIHRHLASLTQPMGAIHGLGIVGRIPIVIVEYDCVRSGQIDTQPTRARAE